MSCSVASTTAIASGVLAACSAICTNTRPRVVVVRGVVPLVERQPALVRRQDLELRDALLGIGGTPREHASGSVASRRSIVSGSNRSVAYSTSACSDAVRELAQDHDRESKRDQLHPGTGSRSSSWPAMRWRLRGDDVVAEQDLEERRVAPRALRVEHLDELLERQLLVGESAEHASP